MKDSLLLLIANLFALGCAYFSYELANKNFEGWGWFLFCGVICVQTFTTKKEKS